MNMAEVPGDVPVEKLLPAIVEKLNLPPRSRRMGGLSIIASIIRIGHFQVKKPWIRPVSWMMRR